MHREIFDWRNRTGGKTDREILGLVGQGWNSRCVGHARAHVENSLAALFTRCLSPRNFHSVRSGRGGGGGRGTTYFAESHYVRKNFTNPRCTVVVVVVGQGFWTGRVIKGMKCTESNYANENLWNGEHEHIRCVECVRRCSSSSSSSSPSSWTIQAPSTSARVTHTITTTTTTATTTTPQKRSQFLYFTAIQLFFVATSSTQPAPSIDKSWRGTRYELTPARGVLQLRERRGWVWKVEFPSPMRLSISYNDYLLGRGDEFLDDSFLTQSSSKKSREDFILSEDRDKFNRPTTCLSFHLQHVTENDLWLCFSAKNS